MGVLDRTLLAERAARLERHLRRISTTLDALQGAPLTAETNECDAVILHLWQATQSVIDLAVSACVKLGLGAPPTYGDAFRFLARAGHLDTALSERLVKAAGFRNVVAHAYDTLDLARVRDAAEHGPADLRGFVAALRDLT